MEKMNQSKTGMVALALFVGVIIVSSLYQYRKDFWIAYDWKQVLAIIIVNGSHQNDFVYEYEVNGIQYNGDGQKRVDSLGSNIHIGSHALVFVSTSHPWLSSPSLKIIPPWEPLVAMLILFSIEFYILKELIRPGRSAQPS